MKRFYENGMKVKDLLELCQAAVRDGYSDALVIVQADVDGISDIVVNGLEGFGDEYGEPDCPIFSITSSENKEHFERNYGPAEPVHVIYKVSINGEFAGVYILKKSYASNFNWGCKPEYIGSKEECEAEAKRWGWKVLDFKPSRYVDNDLWHDFSQE